MSRRLVEVDVKQERRQPRKAAKTRQMTRDRKSSFEAFVRLDKSAVLFLIFAFCLVHWAVRVFIAPIYTIEEADQLLLSQSLQVGYEARQPPMLAWLHGLAIMGGGLSPPIVFAVKYLLLFGALAFYYLAARNVLIKPAVSAAAVSAWALTFQVGWAVHEDLLGAVGLMACLSLSLHAFTRILTWRRYRDWVYLGCTIGVGLLTHHLYVVFPVAMMIAIFLSPFFRDAVTVGRLAVTLLVAALIYGPYAVRVSTHIGSIGDAARDYAASWEIDSTWIDRVRNGAISFGRTVLEFSLPLSLFWLMLFWPLWLPVLYPMFGRRSTDEEPHELAWRRLFARSMLFATLAYLLGVAVGVQTWRGYWLMPALYTLPIWLFAHVKRAGEFPVAVRAFAAVVIAFAMLVVAGRFVEWRMEIEMCEECRPYTPIPEWASELRKAGFVEGTIVGADEHLTGNLRGAFPRSRVLDASIPPDAFPRPRTNGACLAVWRESAFDEQRRIALMPPELKSYLQDSLGARPEDAGAEGAIRRNFRLSGNKAATLYLQFVPPSELCR
jgi:hypothetical protein